MKITLYTFLIGLFLSTNLSVQGQSSKYESIEVSLLTCGTGSDLYTLFGHTALRLRDTLSDQDIVYNWGTFDFGEPGFAGIVSFTSKFLSGKLPYRLLEYPYHYFEEEYEGEGRSVDQQILRLDDYQKQSLIDALVINLQRENRTYKYDFYFDNCVTRPRDILEKVYGGLLYPDLGVTDKTYRDLLHENLQKTPWTKLGMDLILGIQSEDLADTRGQMFLPEYYKNYLSGAKKDQEEVVVQEKRLLSQRDITDDLQIFSPNTLFWGLLLLELIGAFLFYISGDRGFLKLLDRLWFLALGISAVIMLFMWFCTDHTVCANNYNLLWAGPWALGFWIKGRIHKISICLTLFTSLVVLLCWQMIPQSLPLIVIPICLVSILKSLRLLGLFRKMDKALLKFAVFFCCLLSIPAQAQKIDGITLVAPPSEFTADPMPPLVEVHADWVAFVPYAFSRKDNPEVFFGSDRQWWGERVKGVEESIQYAKANNMNVMLKPQVWVGGMWVGDVEYSSEEDWLTWEKTYRAYIKQFVDLAVQYDVEMICIGTEYRKTVKTRESFWRNLIQEIRKKYDGYLTYSANWDDYESVPFWDALDFIGISAYFPLSDMDTPPKILLSYRWRKYVKKLEKYSKKIGRKILFTEFGYLSVDGAAGKTWELEKKVESLDINQQAQANGYDALFDSFWEKDFWAGGFLWKWFPINFVREGRLEKEYTPQDKKAAQILTKWYKKTGR